MKLTAKRLLEQIDRLPVSQAVARGLRIAEATGASDIATWCRLELAGYWPSNPAMNEHVVPEYRQVVGLYADVYGRVLVLSPDFSFVSEMRLRNGLEELETLARTRETVMIHDPWMCGFIREHLQVEVYSYRFSVTHLTGVFSSIREELRQRVISLDCSSTPSSKSVSTSSVEAEEVLELKPGVYGVSVNLRALWRRLWGKPAD